MAQSIEFQLREEVIELKARNARLIAALMEVDHTLSIHGHIDRDTPLHLRVCNVLIENEKP